MKVRLPVVTRRVPHKHGRILRTLLRKSRYMKFKTHKYARSSARWLYVSIMLAALKATVNRGIKSRGPKIKSGIDNVKVTVMGGQYHIRVLTTRPGCPLSCYIELLESEGMQVLHVTTWTSKDKIFHILIVEGDMMRVHDPSGLQRRLYTMASNSSMKESSKKETLGRNKNTENKDKRKVQGI